MIARKCHTAAATDRGDSNFRRRDQSIDVIYAQCKEPFRSAVVLGYDLNVGQSSSNGLSFPFLCLSFKVLEKKLDGVEPTGR
jgi:hypothetical protein